MMTDGPSTVPKIVDKIGQKTAHNPILSTSYDFCDCFSQSHFFVHLFFVSAFFDLLCFQNPKSKNFINRIVVAENFRPGTDHFLRLNINITQSQPWRQRLWIPAQPWTRYVYVWPDPMKVRRCDGHFLNCHEIIAVHISTIDIVSFSTTIYLSGRKCPPFFLCRRHRHCRLGQDHTRP